MRDRESMPWWWVALAIALVAGFVWFTTRPARYDECRERCAAKGFKAWVYNPDRGTCACGGVEP